MYRLLVLLGMVILSCGSGLISAAELHCKSAAVTIDGTNAANMRDGCRAVALASSFLASTGLSIPPDVRIRLVSSPASSPLARHELGNYSAAGNVINVLDYQAAVRATRDGKDVLGRIVTRSHWRSYIVHELTHAAVHMGCDKTCPSRAVHEYIAGVAQLTVLPRGELDSVLSHYCDLAPWEELAEISETYYEMNPHYFAVKSYKHYRQLADPRAFLQRALSSSD